MPHKISDKVLNWASLLDPKALHQACESAKLEIIEGHIALMPDAHWGMGATIGSVIPTYEAIIPSAVGVDIGCGVIAAPMHMTSHDLPDDLTGFLDLLEQRVPAGMGKSHDEIQDRAWKDFVDAHGEPQKKDQKAFDKAPKQFGTLGSGNHFIELCLDENDDVWLMMHSGSRGPGNVLAQKHIKVAKQMCERHGIALPDRDLAYLREEWPEFADYMRDLNWAQAFAYENRNLMMALTIGCLAQATGASRRYMPSEWINNHHNYAALEEHGGRQVWITRKGAIRAQHGQLGVIPGSMGTGSYIVEGLGNPDSYMSASHGAGRAMSRGQARRDFTVEDMEKAMDGKVWLKDHAEKLIDEIPSSYKDLDTVMADQADLVKIKHKLTTLVNYKGTS